MTRFLPLLLLVLLAGCVTKKPTPLRPVVMAPPVLPPIPDRPIISEAIAPPRAIIKTVPFRFPANVVPKDYVWYLHSLPGNAVVVLCDGDPVITNRYSGTVEQYYLRGVPLNSWLSQLAPP